MDTNIDNEIKETNNKLMTNKPFQHNCMYVQIVCTNTVLINEYFTNIFISKLEIKLNRYLYEVKSVLVFFNDGIKRNYS